MTLKLDVTGTGKWELAYLDTVVAEPERLRFRRNHRRLIDTFDIPLVFDTHILAVAASYAQAPATWYNCADIIQVVIGATIDDPDIWESSTGVESIVIGRQRLRLNQSLELFIFQPVSSDLRISFSPLPWIPEFSFGIYAFRGQATNSIEEKIDAARAQLVTIEAKIDLL
ncbi:hypothetical protein QGP82_25485 [Leptothoe sp. LEGE 181152]|nr:hypothetical protein [Leptothoe sp. LEGE 181152]